MRGNDGRDGLRGGPGNDELFGGAGSDRLYDVLGDTPIDRNLLSGGEGDDVLSGRRTTGPSGLVEARGDAGDDTITFGSAGVIAGGGDGDDVIEVEALSADVDGGAGGDTIRLVGRERSVDLTARGGAGADTILGDAEGATIYGEGDNDILDLTGIANPQAFGGSGDDVLFGSDRGGQSLLDGGPGADLFLANGFGFERFVIDEGDTGVGLAADRIRNFSAGTDDLDLVGIDANAATADDDAFSFIGQASFDATDATGQLRLQDLDQGSIVQGSTDLDAAAEIEIRLVNVDAGFVNGGDFIL